MVGDGASRASFRRNNRVQALRRGYTGVRWQTFEEWEKSKDWTVLKEPAK